MAAVTLEELAREVAEVRAITAEEDLDLRSRLDALEEQVAELLANSAQPATAAKPRASKQERLRIKRGAATPTPPPALPAPTRAASGKAKSGKAAGGKAAGGKARTGKSAGGKAASDLPVKGKRRRTA